MLCKYRLLPNVTQSNLWLYLKQHDRTNMGLVVVFKGLKITSNILQIHLLMGSGQGDAILKLSAHIHYKLDGRFLFILNENELPTPEMDLFCKYFHLARMHERISARLQDTMF